GFNLTKPPFRDNPDLRRALSMVIDRDVLVEKITGRGESPAWSWVPPGIDNYVPPQLGYAGMTQEERNNAARGLYRAAGYTEESPLKIEFRYNTSAAEERIAIAVQSMWKDVLGVETTLVNEEFQVLLSNLREKEITQVFRGSWIGDYNDATTFLNLMAGEDPSNMTGFASDEFDGLMNRAASQVDPDRRRLYLEEAERVALEAHAVIPIYFYVSKALVAPEVRGWEDNVLNYHYSQHLSLEAAQ
ncbi:MAG: ABC transporter substrate-binding protein, partial [Woeseiaceae bacterium]